MHDALTNTLPHLADQDTEATALRGRYPLCHILWLLPLLAVLLYAFVLYRTAWLAEDAYIAFRTVDNFVHGRGLTWNPGERVQTYTCPLYVLLYSPVYAIAKEPFYSAIYFLGACSLAAVALVVWHGRRNPLVAALGVMILTCSKAFTDYSTSGLENPLSHLLLAAFFLVFFDERRWTPRRLFAVALLAALTLVNRLDLALIVGPCAVWAWWQTPRRFTAGLLAAVLGAAPLIAWELFSLLYYGFLVPNTAFAKITGAIPPGELAIQGLKYFRASLITDPVTLPWVCIALCVAIRTRRGPALVTAGAVLLYFAYTIKIGGDYMAGRFLTAPLLTAVMLLIACRDHLRPYWTAALCALTLLAGLALPRSPLTSDITYGADYTADQVVYYAGVADERSWYYKFAGLMKVRAEGFMPFPRLYAQGMEDRRTAQSIPVRVIGSAGFRCYYGGATTHYIDVCGLGDPLTARLPPFIYPGWRIGHFFRALPQGYYETVLTGKDHFADRRLGRYYRALHEITSAPLFSPHRLHTILLMNLGRYDKYIDRKYYLHPELRPGEDYRQIPDDGLKWRLKISLPPGPNRHPTTLPPEPYIPRRVGSTHDG